MTHPNVETKIKAAITSVPRSVIEPNTHPPKPQATAVDPALPIQKPAALESATDERDDLTMLVGPDTAARLLEIGVVTGDGIEFIVHAMPARERFLR